MSNVNPAPNAGTSPYMYDLADHRTGGLPEDPMYAAGKQELAKVSATFRASGTAAPSTLKLKPSSDDGMNWRAIPVVLPAGTDPVKAQVRAVVAVF